MGIHDYQCFIHSNGEQCLDTHSECCGKNKCIKQDSDDSQDSWHNDGKIGSSDSICILFKISSKINDPKVALKLLKNGNAKNIRIRRDIEYNWDVIDFMDGDDISGMGYYDSGAYKYEKPLPWKVNNDHRDIPYKKLFWVITICPTCYELLIEEKRDVELCSTYLQDLCDKYKKSYNKKREICRYIRKKYAWLIELIESDAT